MDAASSAARAAARARSRSASMDALRGDLAALGLREVYSRGAEDGGEARSPPSPTARASSSRAPGLKTRRRTGLEPSAFENPGRGARRRHAGAARAERGGTRAGRGRARGARGPARIAAKAMPAGASASANIALCTMINAKDPKLTSLFCDIFDERSRKRSEYLVGHKRYSHSRKKPSFAKCPLLSRKARSLVFHTRRAASRAGAASRPRGPRA